GAGRLAGGRTHGGLARHGSPEALPGDRAAALQVRALRPALGRGDGRPPHEGGAEVGGRPGGAPRGTGGRPGADGAALREARAAPLLPVGPAASGVRGRALPPAGRSGAVPVRGGGTARPGRTGGPDL